LKKLDKYELLILDDIGYVKKSDSKSQVLFELIGHRYERNSLLITTNQAFSEWDSIFGDNMMTVAAIDRLVHHADIYKIEGDSYRRKQAMKSNQKSGQVNWRRPAKLVDVWQIGILLYLKLVGRLHWGSLIKEGANIMRFLTKQNGGIE
jgi:hypothetical protein